MTAIQDYLQDLNRVKAQWRANWVLPYGTAYTRAYRQFVQTMDDQAKADALRAQVAVMVLTIAIGGPICSLFAKSSVGSAAFQGAIDTVTRRNLTRTLAMLQAAERSPAAQFIAGQIWDTASSILTERTKTQVTSLIQATTPASEFIRMRPRDFIDEPQVAQNKIDRYLELVYAAAHQVGEDIRDNGVLTNASKDQMARELRNARFFANAPTRDIVAPPGDGAVNAQLDMELGMYMVLVMNCDYTARGRASADSATATYHERRTSIDVATTSDQYPEGWSRSEVHYGPFVPHWPIFATGVTRHYLEIRYDQLGGTIRDRINQLYRRRFRRDFFNTRLDNEEIRRAERCADQLNDRYYVRIGNGTAGG